MCTMSEARAEGEGQAYLLPVLQVLTSYHAQVEDMSLSLAGMHATEHLATCPSR